MAGVTGIRGDRSRGVQEPVMAGATISSKTDMNRRNVSTHRVDLELRDMSSDQIHYGQSGTPLSVNPHPPNQEQLLTKDVRAVRVPGETGRRHENPPTETAPSLTGRKLR